MPWKKLLKATVAFLLLALLIKLSGVAATMSSLARVNMQVLWQGIALLLLAQWLSSWRWKWLAAPLGIQGSIWRFYRLYLVGMFASLFLPSSVGGDVLKAYSLAKASDQKKRLAVASVLADRVVGFSALIVVMGAISLLPTFAQVPAEAQGVTLFFVAGTVAFWLLWFLPWQRLFGPLLSKLLGRQIALDWLRPWQNPMLILQSMGISVVSHLLLVFLHGLLVQAVGMPPVSWAFLTVVYGLSSIMAVIPISLNGTGLREGAYVVLLATLGWHQADALAMALVFFGITVAVSGLGGLAWLLPDRAEGKPIAQAI